VYLYVSLFIYLEHSTLTTRTRPGPPCSQQEILIHIYHIDNIIVTGLWPKISQRLPGQPTLKDHKYILENIQKQLNIGNRSIKEKYYYVVIERQTTHKLIKLIDMVYVEQKQVIILKLL